MKGFEDAETAYHDGRCRSRSWSFADDCIARHQWQRRHQRGHPRSGFSNIIDRLGYRPSEIARSLVTDRTGTIGLVVIDNSNPFFSEIARGVEQEAYAHGYNVFLCNTEEDISVSKPYCVRWRKSASMA